jgi:hypothetical protein
LPFCEAQPEALAKQEDEMAKKITFTLGALLALTIYSCDGPAEEAIDCERICDEADECISGDFDEAECRQECREDADQDDADTCEACLKDADSCGENTTCAAACAGVGLSVIF